MQKSQNISYYEGLGRVSFVRSARARNLSIRINQRGEVRISIPRSVSQKQAERFFHSKQEWVKKQLNALKIRDCSNSLPREGDILQIRGRELPVKLIRGESNVEMAIWRILQKEALNYLPERVRDLSETNGYEVHGIRIRRMLTRWGSCTARKSINLNSWLVMLPDKLSDYVILHELVHTRIPDHSRRFWEELDRLTGGRSKEYRKELRSRQIMCFPENMSHQ